MACVVELRRLLAFRTSLLDDSAHESVVESPLQRPKCDYIQKHCLFVRHWIAHAGGPGTSIPGLYCCIHTVGYRRSSRTRPAYILIELPYYTGLIGNSRMNPGSRNALRPFNLDDVSTYVLS